MKAVRFVCDSSFQMCNSVFSSKKNEGEIKQKQEAEYEMIKAQSTFSYHLIP